MYDIVLFLELMPQISITIPAKLLAVVEHIRIKAQKDSGVMIPRSAAIQIAILAFDLKKVNLARLVKQNASFDERRK
jgi:hypothetical protein